MVAKFKSVASENPFEIQRGIVYVRVAKTPIESVTKLAVRMKELTAAPDLSIFIPSTECPDEKSARNLFGATKRLIMNDSKYRDRSYIFRLVRDQRKKYVGERVWRQK